jgi:spore coat protein U-like protein
MSRTSVRILAAAIVAILLLADAPAQAASISKTFNAKASVTANCLMSAVGDLSFGAYDPVVANATTGLSGNTSFTLTCTRGSSPVISLSVANANFAKNLAGKRAMNNGTTAPAAGNYLSYDLFVPNGVGDASTAAPSVVYWGDNTSGTSTFSPSVPTVASQTVTIFGTVPPGQDVAAGNYTDSVTATVNY